MLESADLGFTHRFVPGADPAPGLVLLLLHGTGGNEDDLLQLGASLAPGVPLLSPRGKALEHGMPRFFRRLAEGVFDVADLKARTLELGEFVDRARRHYGLEKSAVVPLGYSNGANIASSLLFLRPDLPAGAALLRPMVPFAPDAPPALDGKRILVTAGGRDTTVPPGQTQDLARMLKGYGASVTLHLSDAGHGLTTEDLEVTQRWLAENFLKEP